MMAILDHGSDPTQWMVRVLMSVDNHSFGIINVYAPNDDVERSFVCGGGLLTVCHLGDVW